MAQDMSSSRDAHSTGRQMACAGDRSASEVLRAALAVGEASGEAAPFHVDAFIEDKLA